MKKRICDVVARALIVGFVGLLTGIVDLVILYVYIFFTKDLKANVWLMLQLPLLLSSGFIFVFFEIFVNVFISKKWRLSFADKTITLVLSSIVYCIFMFFVFPYVAESNLLMILMTKADVRGDIAVVFFQVSSCVGAGLWIVICMIGLLIKPRAEKIKK